MDISNLTSVADLAREIGVAVSSIRYHELLGALPTFPKVYGRKVYTPEQADVVRAYFGQFGGRKWVKRDPVTLEDKG